MAVTVHCDACGNEDAGRIVIDVSVSPPLGVSWPRRDCDLCAKCVGKMMTAMSIIWPKPAK